MPQNPDGSATAGHDDAATDDATTTAARDDPGGPGANRRGRAPAAQPKNGVTLVANERENSIVATAPPDKMATIAQAIEAIDVPTDRSQSLLGNISRMQVYRLTGIDPEPVVKTLTQIGNLSPARAWKSTRRTRRSSPTPRWPTT